MREQSRTSGTQHGSNHLPERNERRLSSREDDSSPLFCGKYRNLIRRGIGRRSRSSVTKEGTLAGGEGNGLTETLSLDFFR
jgi:hypothetical protein